MPVLSIVSNFAPAAFEPKKLQRFRPLRARSRGLGDGPDLRGASWGDDGAIVAALRVAGPLYRVPASGGAPVEVTRLEGNDRSHRWPQLLHGSRTVLFTDNFAADRIRTSKRGLAHGHRVR